MKQTGTSRVVIYEKKGMGISVSDKILTYQIILTAIVWFWNEGERTENRFISKHTFSNNYKGTATMLRRNFNFKTSCKMVAVIAYDIRSLCLMACIIWKNTNMSTESQFGAQSWHTGKFRSFQACMGNSCAYLHKMRLVNFLKFAVRED